jgi:hypothetical protein
MQDRESQSDVNPGRVEQRLDEAPVEREGMQGGGGVEREGTQGDEPERERLQHGARSGGTENTTGGSDPMPRANDSSN